MEIYRLTILNNKSRKGLYIYVREPGKRAKYFKYTPERSIDIIETYYKLPGKEQTRKRLKEIETKWKERPEKERKERKERTKIDRSKLGIQTTRAIRKGEYHVKIKDVLNLPESVIAYKEKELINLALDKSLKKYIGIFTQHTNLQKLRKYMTIKARVYGKDGSLIATLDNYGKKTIREAVEDLNSIKKGENIVYSMFEEKLGDTWQKRQLLNNGKIHSIEMDIILHK